MPDRDRRAALDAAIELMYFGYRGMVAMPDRLLAERGLGRAHHRILFFVARLKRPTVSEVQRTLAVSNLVFSSPEGLSFGPMRLVVTFEAVEEGTDVTVVQEGIEEGPVWESFRDQLGPGWERMLGGLKAWLEEGKKLPGR